MRYQCANLAFQVLDTRHSFYVHGIIMQLANIEIHYKYY